MKQQNKNERLELFSDLYSAAMAACRDTHDRLDKNMRQYLGTDEVDGSSERATVVRNITYEIIESEITPAIPMPRVDVSSYSDKRSENAKAIERLCRAIRARLPLEVMNDRDERYTYIYGASVWYIEWDSDISGVMAHCISPLDFIPQPGIEKVEDMEYCFLRFTTTRGELVRKYGVDVEKIRLAECEYEYPDEISSSDTVRLVVAFYRDADGFIGRFIFSGGLVLSDIPDFYRRRGAVCKICGAPRGECDCGEGHKKGLIKNERVSLEGERISVPYYVPDSFPIVIRKNTFSPTGYLGSSDCEKIRPQQQAINKIETRIMQKLLRSGVTPVMPEDATVSLNNAVFGQVIKLRAGENLEHYGKIDTTPDISQDIMEADRLYDQAKRVLGISDALQGTDDNTTESGYARQLKLSQASSRLESKKRLKSACYAEIYRLVFKHYLAFSGECENLCYKDDYGKAHTSRFIRTDFIESDGRGGYKYCDEYLFSVDDGEGEGYQRESLWERNLKNLESGTLGDKNSPLTLLRYWQSQERAHYPFAAENVEYFTNIVNSEKEKENDRDDRNT